MHVSELKQVTQCVLTLPPDSFGSHRLLELEHSLLSPLKTLNSSVPGFLDFFLRLLVAAHLLGQYHYCPHTAYSGGQQCDCPLVKLRTLKKLLYVFHAAAKDG